jgi:serine/threonine protein kinase
LLERKDEFAMAVSDMAVEAAYLSRMDHPHIIPLRGLPATGLHALDHGSHDGFFLILDRLYQTLDQRISNWKKQQDCHEDEETLQRTKMEHALQLARALDYLHQKRLIFRDLKPHNIGFNHEGRLQLFDFGLCRDLPPATNDLTDVYEMSGVGTRRYMAPETLTSKCYNAKADVYSWAMVVCQMFTLNKPYPEYSMEEHTRLVCHGGERPALDSSVPQALRILLAQSWCQSISERSSISETILRLEKALQEAPLLYSKTFSAEISEVIHRLEDRLNEEKMGQKELQEVPLLYS